MKVLRPTIKKSLVMVMLSAIAAGLLSAVTPSASDDRYSPLKEGMEWTMDAVMIGPDQRKMECIGRRTISNPVKKDGKDYLTSRTWIERDGKKLSEYTKLVRRDAKGFHSIFIGPGGGTEETELQLPLVVGAEWQVESPMRMKYSVVAKESVTIGERTYEDCFKIRAIAGNGEMTEDFWEAPNVGSVKAVIRYPSGASITLTLREFVSGK